VSAEQPTRDDAGHGTLPAHERTSGSRSGDAPLPLAETAAESERLREFFTNVPCGYALLAMDGSIRDANPAFLELSGAPADSLRQVRFQQLLSRAGAIFYETQFVQAILLQGVLREVAFDLVRPSGERLAVLVNAALRRGPEGTPNGIYLAVFQATDRRLYERDLLIARKNSEQLADVVRRSSEAIFKVAPDGTIQSWNDGAEQMFGYSHAEVLGQSLAYLLFSEEKRDTIDEAVRILAQGLQVKHEIQGVRKDGSKVELAMALTPHMEAPGILVAFSAVIRDVSSEKLAERALLQSEKLASVGRLASSIAHEINNPLESVTNLLYILESQVDTSDMKALVRTAQEELARVSQIATHTLRFHRQSTRRTALDVGSLLVSVLALYRARLQNSGITALIGRSDSSPLYCYEGEIRQILLNLVGNAVDATHSGGRLVLRNRDATLWSSGDRGVRITIADTGVGMDEQTLRRIFEPFFTTKGIAGTGLGLWITQQLVANNQGLIRVRTNNKAGHSGTVFTLLFPHHAHTQT
jgi:PAS domain S-box-containing protein